MSRLIDEALIKEGQERMMKKPHVFLIFPHFKAIILEGKCPTCENPLSLLGQELDDEISVREFLISFRCQECQDRAFDRQNQVEEEEYDEYPSTEEEV